VTGDPGLGWENEAVHVLFVYGTLLSGEANHPVLSGAEFRGPASTLPEFELVDLGAYPALVRGGRDAVSGELYRVSPELLRIVDSFEGHPTLFRRSVIALRGGAEAEAYLVDAGRVSTMPRIKTGDWRARARSG
jgi:gamma-glutamylaminecyclotransferase